MTDRELLELAAKAAGINQTGWDDTNPGIEPALVAVDENDCAYHWNPLTDDGDAFRLAVKLRIDIAHALDFVVVAGDGTASSLRRENGAGCSATRRAIVRAAAEIGMAMK